MIATLPPPSALLGLSPSDARAFPAWYPNQDRVMRMVLDWITDPNGAKYFCVQAGTGTGKSLLAAITAQLSGTRAAVLTSTKGLQDQFLWPTFIAGRVPRRARPELVPVHPHARSQVSPWTKAPATPAPAASTLPLATRPASTTRNSSKRAA